MNVVLLFFALMLVTGMRAAQRGRTNRTWPLVLVSVMVTLAFLSQRAY